MYLLKDASRIRQAEAQNARNNRAEIVKALSQGQITKRELLKWGIFTTGGLLIAKNGLSPCARSAFAGGPTGAPRTPLFGAQKFIEKFNRMRYQKPTALTKFATVRMPNLGLSEFDASDVIAFIEAQSYSFAADAHQSTLNSPGHAHHH